MGTGFFNRRSLKEKPHPLDFSTVSVINAFIACTINPNKTYRHNRCQFSVFLYSLCVTVEHLKMVLWTEGANKGGRLASHLWPILGVFREQFQEKMSLLYIFTSYFFPLQETSRGEKIDRYSKCRKGTFLKSISKVSLWSRSQRTTVFFLLIEWPVDWILKKSWFNAFAFYWIPFLLIVRDLCKNPILQSTAIFSIIPQWQWHRDSHL